MSGSVTHTPPCTQLLAGPEPAALKAEEMSMDWLQAVPLSVPPSVKCLRIVMNAAEKRWPFAGQKYIRLLKEAN